MNICEMMSCIACYTTIIFFTVLTVALGYCTIKLLYPSVDIGTYAELVTAIIAILAFIIALKEYLALKDTKQANVLSEYNKRYSDDPNIVKVVKYLNYIDENGTYNNPHREKPSNYEVEMFMRFFEELDLQIKYKRLDKEDVTKLFVYYAKMLSDKQDLRQFLGVDEGDYKENWEGFRRITNINKTI